MQHLTQAVSAQSATTTDLPPSPLLGLSSKIWLEVLKFLTGPYVEVIHGTANAAQQSDVTASRIADGSNAVIPLISAYHLLVTYDDVSESITSVKIGFCKKIRTELMGLFKEQIVYKTSIVDKKSSLFRYVTERPLTFNQERILTEAQDLLLFKYLIPEIKAASGLTKHPMHDLLQFANANPRLHGQLLSLDKGPHPLIAYAFKMLLHHQVYHELEVKGSQATSDISEIEFAATPLYRILNSHPEFLHPNYQGNVTDTSLARTWKTNVINLALVHRQRFMYAVITSLLKNSKRLSAQQCAEIKTALFAQIEKWDYPHYFVVGTEDAPDKENLPKGIYLYCQKGNVYALVVHNNQLNETLDLTQCFAQQGLTLQRTQEELGEIQWPETAEVPRIVAAQSPLPTIIKEAIFHSMQHPNGLEYMQDNLLAQGVRILDADEVANNPDEKARYEQEVVTHNGYHLIIKMKPANPAQDQQLTVESCVLGLRDPDTKAYRQISVPSMDELFLIAGKLHTCLRTATDIFKNSLSHYVTRGQRDLLVVEKFLKTQSIERNFKGETSRVNMFSLWCSSQNYIGRWQAWSNHQGEFDNLHTVIYKLLRAVPAEFLQIWMSSNLSWWKSLPTIENFVRNWKPNDTDARCINFDNSCLHPLSSFLGTENYVLDTPWPQVVTLRGPTVARGWHASEFFLEAETQAQRNLKMTLKAN